MVNIRLLNRFTLKQVHCLSTYSQKIIQITYRNLFSNETKHRFKHQL